MYQKFFVDVKRNRTRNTIVHCACFAFALAMYAALAAGKVTWTEVSFFTEFGYIIAILILSVMILFLSYTAISQFCITSHDESRRINDALFDTCKNILTPPESSASCLRVTMLKELSELYLNVSSTNPGYTAFISIFEMFAGSSPTSAGNYIPEYSEEALELMYYFRFLMNLKVANLKKSPMVPNNYMEMDVSKARDSFFQRLSAIQLKKKELDQKDIQAAVNAYSSDDYRSNLHNVVTVGNIHLSNEEPHLYEPHTADETDPEEGTTTGETDPEDCATTDETVPADEETVQPEESIPDVEEVLS